MKFEKQIILVTAATRGIGLATVKAAAQEGATVYMAARDMDRARELTPVSYTHLARRATGGADQGDL